MSYVHVDSAPLLTGLSGLGQPAPTLSGGQFGLAMSRIRIPAKAIELLVLSKTFRTIAGALDKAYLDHRFWNDLRSKNEKLTLDSGLRVTGGGASVNGRRILYVDRGPVGSLFIPGQSTETPVDWDFIRIAFSLDDSDVISWVRAIAHESAHALRRVRSRGPGPSAPADRAVTAVLDECAVRRIEQRVVEEIRLTSTGKAALSGFPPPPPPEVCDCERDWFPANQKRTYLEQFVLGTDWESAARAVGQDQSKKIKAAVAAIPLLKPSSTYKPSIYLYVIKNGPIAALAKDFPVLKSSAGRAAFVLRVVDQSWRELLAKVNETSSMWRRVREVWLDRHVRLFFKIPVSYTKCP